MACIQVVARPYQFLPGDTYMGHVTIRRWWVTRAGEWDSQWVDRINITHRS